MLAEVADDSKVNVLTISAKPVPLSTVRAPDRDHIVTTSAAHIAAGWP
jgi:hypothetical protein